MDDLGEKLFHCLTDGLSTWWTENQSCHQRRVHLFVVLITEHRTLLLAFQQHPSMVNIVLTFNCGYLRHTNFGLVDICV